MLRRIHGSDRAVSTLEYVALLTLVTGVVTALVVWGLNTLPGQTNAGVSNAVCTILNLDNCDTSEATDGGADGDGTDNSGTGSDSSDDGSGADDDGAGDPEEDGAEGENDGTEDSGSGDGPGDEGADSTDPEQAGYDPDLAQEAWNAQQELEDAEAALEEAEASGDELLEELLDLLWEITGGADIERCFTEGDIGSCIMAAIGLIPWGKLLKVGSKIPKMWRLFDRWRDARRARNARKTDVDNARTRRDDAVDACRVNSFVPGTPVLLADGTYRAIEDVEVGDEVLAFDPLTGEEGPREVIDLPSGSGEKTLVAITVDDGSGSTDTLTATSNHPFWVPEHADWVDATELEPGVWLRTASGDWVEVSAVTTETVRDQQVHNLTVADLHTYYAGAGDTPLLTHNCAGPVTLSDDVLDTHVLPRHGPGTPGRGSKFADNIDPDDYGALANDAVRGSPVPSGPRDPVTGNHPHTHEFPYNIGTDGNGNPTNKLRVWVDDNGNVATMHPV